jgi:F0F1-type ATP synthase delta subunit
MMGLQLPNSVCSAQDLAALELELHDYTQWFAHNAVRASVKSTKGAAAVPVLSSVALGLLREWNKKALLSQQSLDELLTAIKMLRHESPSMTITLAALPGNELKQQLVGWCRENLQPNILVTFQFNRSLLGGMVVRWGSHVFDWSFRRQILANADAFPEVLRRV